LSSTYLIKNGYKIYTNKLLGSGLTSFVYEGEIIVTGQRIAIKIIDKLSIKNKKIKNIINNEIIILKLLKDYPEFVRLYDNFEDISKYYLVFEYAESCLNDIINSIDTNNIFFYLKQLLIGMIKLSKLHIIHNDIKPANILIINNQLKISDFGMSEFIEDLNNTHYGSVCGSPYYMNINKYNGIHSFETDFWSIKIIYYQMVYSQHPFHNIKTVDELKEKLKRISLNKDSINFTTNYDPHTDLLKKLFNNEIKNAEELLNIINEITKDDIINMDSIKININEISKKFNKDKSQFYNTTYNSMSQFIDINNSNDYENDEYDEYDEYDENGNLDEIKGFILL
jgi:serine/threonine protein kinase